MIAPEFEFDVYEAIRRLVQSLSILLTGPTMDPAPNGASPSSSAGNLTPSMFCQSLHNRITKRRIYSGAYRNMARRIQTYPWKTAFVLTQDDLTQGWEHNGNNEAGWITYQDIEVR